MASKGFILIFIFVFSTGISTGCAQENEVIPPPDWGPKTYTFMSPELLVNSLFIKRLNQILFEKRQETSNRGLQHVLIHFEKKDSIIVCLWDTPVESDLGFFEYNNYFYWFSGDIPPLIILKTKEKKRFSYKDYGPKFFDPPFWYLKYNVQTGDMILNQKESYY